MFHFVANLKPYTLRETTDDHRFDAYLLSADYASGFADLAAVVRAEQRVLVADNGNMDSFRSLAKAFTAEAAELDTARKAWEDARGRYARPQELPAELRSRFRSLAEKLAARSRAITTDTFTRDAVSRQTSINPSMLVGMEDFTLGTMTGLNIEPEYADLPESFFAARIRQAVTYAQRTTNGEFGEVSGQVLAGLHALDYDSGALAGQIAAEAGIDGVTVGMFAALTDRNYVDYRVEDGKIIKLATAVPRPYLRVIELTAGVLEGFRRAGRPRPAFHALGVGTPILLPLLSLLSQGERYFATDSTAPIVDGWSSPTISLYVIEPAPLKYKAYRIADVWIRGGRGWDCECPHCSRFRDAHPPELGRAQKWWREQGKPDIKKQMLERQGPLSAWLPFLGYCADDDLRTEAGLARVGHNHWALRQLELEIRRRSESWPDLLGWVEDIVGAYQKASGSAPWKAAVSEAFALARSVGERRAASSSDPDVPSRRLLDDDVKIDENKSQRCEQGKKPDRDRSPHHTEPGVASQPPPGVVGHGHSVANLQPNDNRPGARRGLGYHAGMPFDFLVGHGGCMSSHQPSRALLRNTLERLGQIENLPRTWEKTQPLAADLAGLAASILDVLRLNTAAVLARTEQQAEQVDAWRAVLSDIASSTSDDTQTWREALLTAASKTSGAPEAKARVETLLQGDAAVLRVAELSRRASHSAQSPFVDAYAAAIASSFRLSCLSSYLAAAASDDDDNGPATIDEEVVCWLTTYTQELEEFTSSGFAQFYDLLVGDNASVVDARVLAEAILDEAGVRGLSVGQVLGVLSRQGIAAEWLGAVGPVVTTLAETDTRLRLLVAYSADVLAHSHSLEAESWWETERRRTESDFSSKVPTGTHARLDELGGLDDDALVEVQGQVESLALEHDPVPPKFSTFVVLRAFDGGATVRLRAHMFSLQKNGLVAGACCKIRGFIRRQQSWLSEDETGLDIDRVSLSKLRKTSWLDGVAYRMRPFFRLYQDEMNLFNTPGGL